MVLNFRNEDMGWYGGVVWGGVVVVKGPKNKVGVDSHFCVGLDSLDGIKASGTRIKV